MKKKIFSIIISVIMLLGLMSCSSTPPDTDGKVFEDKFSAEEFALYDSLFNTSNVISISIDITKDELYKIQTDYEAYCKAVGVEAGKDAEGGSETYRKCNLTISINDNKQTINDVGIRMKGNQSTTNFCSVNGHMYNFVHFKFKFDETFDGEEYKTGDTTKIDWTNKTTERDARKNRTFATLKSIYVKWNLIEDNTYSREIYASKMFKAFDIPAQNITLAQVKLAQQYDGVYSMENLGVFTLSEALDKTFIRRNYNLSSTQVGDLYKCRWAPVSWREWNGADFTKKCNYGVPTETKNYNYNLKTNETTSKNESLKKCLSVLNDTSQDASDFNTKIESVIDMDKFTSFEAVNYWIGNPDCIKNNENNHYLYFDTNGIGTILPYDNDRCFGITNGLNWSHDGMMSATPYETKCKDSNTENPLYLKTILSTGTSNYQAMFKSKLENVINSEWTNYAKFLEFYNTFYANYNAVATPSNAILSQCKLSASQFAFGLDGTSDYATEDGNISAETYFTTKKATALASIQI